MATTASERDDDALLGCFFSFKGGKATGDSRGPKQENKTTTKPRPAATIRKQRYTKTDKATNEESRCDDRSGGAGAQLCSALLSFEEQRDCALLLDL